MDKRKLGKAIKRLTHLPGGTSFFQYSGNKLNHFSKKITGSTKIANPSTLMLEVTNHCNLKCITCPREYAYGDQMDVGTMPLDELKKVVDQAFPYIDSIGLTGLGEPLIYKYLDDALRYIKQKNKGIITSLSTNANLPGTIEKFKKILPYIDTVQISMDGIGDAYENVRKKGSFNDFLSNVKQMKTLVDEHKTDTDLMFNVVVVKENYHQMAELVKLASELGIHYLNFSLFNIAAVTNLELDYYDFYKSKDFNDAFNVALNEAKKHPKLQLTHWDTTGKCGFKECFYPWSHFYITWDGFVAPCCSKPFPKEGHFGNVFKSSLMDCLNSEGFQNFRKMWYANQTPKFCEKCNIVELAIER